MSASARITRPQAPPATLAAIPGIGPKRSAALAARGIATAADVLFHLPMRYQDWRVRRDPLKFRPGMTAAIEGELGALSERPMPGARWRWLVSGRLTTDEGAEVRLVWFNLPAHMSARMPGMQRVVAHGRVSLAADSLEIVHPELHPMSEGAPRPIRPIYSLPGGVPQRLYSRLAVETLETAQVSGAIPESMRRERGLPPLITALKGLHLPPPDADIEALRRGDAPEQAALAMDEMFAFQLALALERARGERRAGIAFDGPRTLTRRFIAGLPFGPTGAQLRAIREIEEDMARARPMNRLLMGDVGSGKTVAAFFAALRATECGAQAAMMAPTELLAEQHHRNFIRMCDGLGVRAGLLAAGVSGPERARTLRALAAGEMSVVFGTQALIQQGVKIKNLGLAIIDEQHRFGVFDRARLKELGVRADALLMTATPIPRSLALTLFANLAVSVLDEMPPGRAPIATHIFGEDQSDAVDSIVSGEIAAGRRAYYVMPLIDGEEDVPSVTAMARRLKAVLPGARLGVLHGRMRGADKEAAMRKFLEGAVNLLVATTVVEVGIDVPEATVIVVAGAERYGLAQLHQLRGRVGRGRWPSRCCLMVSQGADERARERLDTLVRSRSGAEVAHADLKLRGPGNLFGARQSGSLPLRFGAFLHDPAPIEIAREMAEEWLRRDPKLERPESAGARQAVARMLEAGFSLGDVG